MLLARLRPFLLIASALLLLVLALEHLNGRFWLNDFRVYYMAADAMCHGRPMYGVAFGEDTGLYKYVPVGLYFFVPYTLLEFHTAAVIHFLLMGAVLLACFVVMEYILGRYIVGDFLPRSSLRAGLGLLCIVVLLSRELHLGNINLGLVLLVVAGTERYLAGKRWQAGICFGTIWLIKPYLLLMLVPLVVRRDRRVLGSAGITMAVGLLIPMLFEGPVGWVEQLQAWVASMAHHTKVLDSPDRVGALLGHALGALPPLMDRLFIALAGLALAGWTRHHVRTAPTVQAMRMDQAVELWMAFACVPNLVITDQEHFLFALPLMLFVLAYLFTHRDRTVLMAFIGAMLLHATRSTDLWGSPIENKLVGWGVLGMGNILLMATALLAGHRWRRNAAAPLRS
ncbi:MAG: DUF2029 domain-containing protein [Bacteroidetes bacterium]|nr:DUF2029 domain-containing protein [Bacteroidota bacterium]